MKIRQSEVVTGIFVMVALAILAFLAFKSVNQLINKRVECVAYFEAVDLLEESSVVAIKGLGVGKVLSIDPVVTADGLRIRVIFDVAPDSARQLKFGTSAKIEQASFLGTKYVAIDPVYAGADLPNDDGKILISAIPSEGLFDQIKSLKTEYLEPTLANLRDMSKKLNEEWLSDKNRDQVADLLVNTNALITNLQKNIDDLAVKLNGKAGQPGVLDRTNTLLDNADGLVTDMRGNIGELTTSAKNTLGNVDTVLASAKRTLDDTDTMINETLTPKVGGTLDSAKALMENLQSNVDHLIVKTDSVMDNLNVVLTHPDLFATLYEAQTALRQVKILMANLSADPSQLIWGGNSDPDLLSPPKSKDEIERQRSGRAKPYGY